MNIPRKSQRNNGGSPQKSVSSNTTGRPANQNNGWQPTPISPAPHSENHNSGNNIQQPNPVIPTPQPAQPVAEMPGISGQNVLLPSEQLYSGSLKTDKAAYKPGETVRFTLDNFPGGEVYVRYSQAGKAIGIEKIADKEWTWQAPGTGDNLGYLAEIFSMSSGGKERSYATIAIDVSSD